MLVARRALELVLVELDRVAAGAGETRRDAPLDTDGSPHAAPAGAADDVRLQGGRVARGRARDGATGSRTVQTERLAAQLGGAAGTLAVLGEHGVEVLRLFAEELDLAEPTLPWHTNRTRIAELGGALDTTAGVLAKIGLDIALLSQTEVGRGAGGPGGGSSTLPQKRNPVRSTLARASAQLASGHASVLARTVVQEHERAAGAWQAEWEALSGALAFTGGAACGDRRRRGRARGGRRSGCARTSS